MADIIKRMDDLERRMEELCVFVYAEIPKINVQISELHKQLNNANGKSDEAMRLKIEIDESKDDIEALVARNIAVNNRLDEQVKAIYFCIDEFKDNVHSKDWVLAMINSIHHSMSDQREDLFNHISRLEGNIYDSNKNNEVKLNNMKTSFDMHPDEIRAFKEDILKKHESVALDGTNSVIRSSNNEQQLKILEKRVENIYLLLKKYELSKS